MNWHRSIRSKLITIMLLISMGALTAGMLLVGISYYNSTRQAMIDDARTQAELLAEGAKGVVSFGGFENQSAELLKSIRLSSDYGAAIFDFKGSILAASDDKDGAFYISASEFKDHSAQEWSSDRLYIWQAIESDGEFLGCIYLKISTDGFYQKINRMLLLNAGIVAVLFVVIYLVAARLQESVSRPLAELDRVSNMISDSGNECPTMATMKLAHSLIPLIACSKPSRASSRSVMPPTKRCKSTRNGWSGRLRICNIWPITTR